MASSSSHSVKSRLQLFWLFAIVVCCMICVVARQQCQIYTIQRELNSLLELEDLSDELRDGDMVSKIFAAWWLPNVVVGSEKGKVWNCGIQLMGMGG